MHTRSLIIMVFFSALFIACSDESTQTPLPTPSYIITDAEAFNRFDTDTFSNSSCLPLALETPQGIFVSTRGKSSAAGTLEDPLDLQTALSSSSPVQAGETIWLDQGVYKGNFSSDLRGSEAAPIKVKPLPGKRVVLDGNVKERSSLSISGTWTEYYALEIVSSSPNHISQERGSNPSDLKVNGGVTITGANTKLINFIAHDNIGGGISSWSNAPDSEMYGNIIYNNGWSAPDRGHGHAIYAQNKTGYKKITNNIIFFGYGTGIHVYTEGGQIEGFDVQKNTWFMTGASDPRSSQKKDNCLIGGYQPVKRLTMKDNLGYSENSRGTRIGYGGSVVDQDAVMQNNYLSENFWIAGSWRELNVSNTTVHRGIRNEANITTSLNNDFTSLPNSGQKVVVSANAYDPRRARIVIYNFDEALSVAVDLSSVLKVGEAYRIHSVYALFDDPMLTGIYGGGTVDIPMGNIAPPQPVGNIGGVDESDDPHKKFGVFIVTHAECQ